MTMIDFFGQTALQNCFFQLRNCFPKLSSCTPKLRYYILKLLFETSAWNKDRYWAASMTVCKQIERSVVKFCRSLFHLILPNVKVKMPILWIFYYLILMLASSFWFVVFFPSLSSADKTEKDMFECQILASRTPLKWLPFLIHDNKSLELLTT